ncbi:MULTISPECIES: energy transducer TonB family protein [Pseudanabaena]|uniref:energy transducer TonB family protein n=1 Tax=Pseudanabaena TaxID=1152 RepID=UPI00247A5A30|nr:MULTISPECIES: energy transducer TonB [Pseudanabaena]MEA5488496.1 energy transducer TonB [Pseudanabaena sp. CCNP1317]WGS74298.1 energy transducer TonB [Pseudanabaena galeata CCNP1313]
MHEPILVNALTKKENKALTSLLFIGLVGSTCVHAAVMIAPVPTLWKTASKDSDDIIEIVVEATQSTEDKVPEIAKELEPIPPVNEEIPQIEAAPVAIALAPETIAPVKEGKDAAASDDLKPLTTQNTSDVKVPQGGGPIIANNGIGSGFGNSKIPTGFILGGKKNGNPDGKKNGVIDGVTNGKPDSKGTQTSALPPAPSVEAKAVKLECLSCPKPQYRGKEGTPRVTYDITPDGRVINVRLRQSSGDEQTDRETLEAMSKWQFNPQTVPEGGRANVRVRITFEEEGSKFQRQNEERRRQESERLAAQEAEQRRLAAERRQREAESLKPTAVTIPVNPEPVRSPESQINSPEPVTTPVQPIINSPAPTVTEPVVQQLIEPVVDNPSPIAPSSPSIEATPTPDKTPSSP